MSCQMVLMEDSQIVLAGSTGDHYTAILETQERSSREGEDEHALHEGLELFERMSLREVLILVM